MMFADEMFPKLWHFSDDNKCHPGDPTKPSKPLRNAPHIPRSLAPPTYVFIDFDISMAFRPGVPQRRPGIWGTEEPPEMGELRLIDTFAADIWCLGKTLHDALDESQHIFRYKELTAILRPFIGTLMASNPSKRPSAREALEDFQRIIRSLSDSQLRQTLRDFSLWSYAEIKYAALAILEGRGDERILFANLRGNEPPEPKSFAAGSLRDRVELTGKVIRFLINVSSGRNVLEWIAPKGSKT